MPRESTIQVYRSNTTVIPTGMNFGELAFTDVAGVQRLWIGNTGGAAVWIGAGVTDGGLANNSSVLVPTQSAVKSYVDGIVGGGSVVNSVNNSNGNIVVTGDSGAIIKYTSGASNTFTARVATSSLTGVAAFNSTYYSVSAAGVVTPTAQFQVTGDTVSAGAFIGLIRSGNQAIVQNIGVHTFNGLTGVVTITGDGAGVYGVNNNTIGARIATTSLTGVAAFNSTYYSVSAAGVVTPTAPFQVTGDTVSINTGSSQTLTRSGNQSLIDNRIATTSLTGVAAFNSTYYSVSAPGVVTPTAPFQVTGDTVSAGAFIGLIRNGTQATVQNIGVHTFNGLTGVVSITGDGGALYGTTNNTIGARVASTSLTGVASFNSTDFTVSAAGAVTLNTLKSYLTLRDGYMNSYSAVASDTITLTGGNGVEVLYASSRTFSFRGATATATTNGVASFPTADFTITSGAVNLKDVVRSFNGQTGAVGDKIATASVTGVASFNSTYYSVSAAGAVTPTAPFQVTGDTVSAGAFIGLIRNGTQATVQNIGVHTFNGLTGVVSITGDGGALYGTTNNTIGARLATTGVTGVASFNSSHFSVSAGAVSSVGLTVKASSTDAGSTLNLGGTLTITGAANQIDVSRSGTTYTIGFPNDITVPGNLTVNGTVITANVDNFVVEDPLFMLGTGNAADSVDLGFYSLYTNSGRKFTGLFRDASDSGKYKLFTGLTGAAEPTTTVNDAASGYAIATLVANIDGGTF